MDNNQIVQSSTQVDNVTIKIELPLTPELKKSLSFAGTMQQIVGVLILSGAMSCLGIITAIVGIPVLMSGIRLFNSGSNFSVVASTGDEKQLTLALTNLSSYWKWLLIGIVLVTVSMFLFFILLGVFISSLAH